MSDDKYLGKRFESKDWRDYGRKIRVEAVSANQLRAGQPAKSTVYDCREHGRTIRIQAHILDSKWREIA